MTFYNLKPESTTSGNAECSKNCTSPPQQPAPSALRGVPARDPQRGTSAFWWQDFHTDTKDEEEEIDDEDAGKEGVEDAGEESRHDTGAKRVDAEAEGKDAGEEGWIWRRRGQWSAEHWVG